MDDVRQIIDHGKEGGFLTFDEVNEISTPHNTKQRKSVMAKKKESYEKLVQNIERLEIMEGKYGVSFVGLNAMYDTNNSINGIPCANVEVYGEIHSINGAGILESIDVIATAYDSTGKVLGTGSERITADKFFVLCPIKFHFKIIDFQEPSKLRIYPAKSSW